MTKNSINNFSEYTSGKSDANTFTSFISRKQGNLTTYQTRGLTQLVNGKRTIAWQSCSLEAEEKAVLMDLLCGKDLSNNGNDYSKWLWQWLMCIKLSLYGQVYAKFPDTNSDHPLTASLRFTCYYYRLILEMRKQRHWVTVNASQSWKHMRNTWRCFRNTSRSELRLSGRWGQALVFFKARWF